MRTIKELQNEARSGTGSHMYRCYNYHSGQPEFHCKNCIDNLPSYIEVESNPMANMFAKCETCGYQHKDKFLSFFLYWMFFFTIIGFSIPTYIHENMGIDILFGKHTMYWAFLSLYLAFGGGFVMFLIRSLQKKIRKEW